MKRLLLLVYFVSLGIVGFGQKMEVAVGYGTPSLYGVTESVIGGFETLFTGSNYTTTSNGVLNVQVTRYDKEERWRYGLEFNNEFFDTSGELKSTTYYSISPKVDHFWSASHRKLRFYSGIAAGVLIRGSKTDSDSASDAFFAMNITPIAIRYGREFGVFLAPNIGVNAFLQLGLSYQF